MGPCSMAKQLCHASLEGDLRTDVAWAQSRQGVMETRSDRPRSSDASTPPKQSPQSWASGDEIESRAIDEHLYSSWLNQIRHSNSTDVEINPFPKSRSLVEELVASRGFAQSGDTPDLVDPTIQATPSMPPLVTGPPQVVREAPVSLYRAVAVLASIVVTTAFLSLYEIMLPQRRAEAYKTRIESAIGQLEDLNSSYRQLLSAQMAPDFREASNKAKQALQGVMSFKRVTSERPPSKLPLTVFGGRPDPAAVKSDVDSLIQAMDPIVEQVQLRSALFGAVADYREQLTIARSALTSEGIEGEDKTVVVSGIASNLEAIKATLERAFVPKGCEEFYVILINHLNAVISEMRGILNRSGGQLSSPTTPLPDTSAVLKAIVEADSSITNARIYQALPKELLDMYEARLNNIKAQYVVRP